MPNTPAGTVYTIGHSTRTVVELSILLRQVAVDLLIDVRAFPRSRTNPQFNSDVLPQALVAVGLGYRHLPTLGGRRRRASAGAPSVNSLWRNSSFRNYADYSATDEFRVGFAELLALSGRHCCAIMCAEALWWQCHRRIITDYLLVEGLAVTHIMGNHNLVRATLTPGAQRAPDGAMVYRGPAPVQAPLHGGRARG